MTPAAHRKTWPIIRRIWQLIVILTFILGLALLAMTIS